MQIFLLLLLSCSHSSKTVENFFFQLCEESLKPHLNRTRLESFYENPLKEELTPLSQEKFIELFSSEEHVLAISLHYNSCIFSFCKILYTVHTENSVGLSWITKELRLKKIRDQLYVYRILPISSRYELKKH